MSADWQRVTREIRATYSPKGRTTLGLCSLEGLRVFERALASGAQLTDVLVDDAFQANASERYQKARAQLREHSIRVHPIEDAAMQELTGGRQLGGIIGLAKLPQPAPLQDLLAAGPNAPTPLLVAGIGFNDPGNVGALVRTGHAAGVAAVLSVGSTDAFHPRAVRTSMGSVFRIPVLTYPDIAAMAQALRQAGIRTLGAITQGGLPLPEIGNKQTPTAVIMGSEAFGLSTEDQAHLDELVTIPMTQSVDSYSVNAAAAVMLYEMRR